MTISIIDASADCTAKLPALKARGVVSIGRYLNRMQPNGAKVIKPAEARAFAAVGMRLFLIYEYNGRPFGSVVGKADGEWARAYAPTIGAPLNGSAFIAYTVDYDAPENDMTAIKSAFTAFDAAIKPAFKTWSYAGGAVNAELFAAELIDGRWLTCSGGFRGTKQALASGAYEMRQALPQEISGVDTDPDSSHVADYAPGFVPFAEPAP